MLKPGKRVRVQIAVHATDDADLVATLRKARDGHFQREKAGRVSAADCRDLQLEVARERQRGQGPRQLLDLGWPESRAGVGQSEKEPDACPNRAPRQDLVRDLGQRAPGELAQPGRAE